MKEIKALIRKEMLTKVAKGLKKEHFCCFTVFEGEGVGDYIDPETEFPSLNFPFLHHSIIKIEIVCNKQETEKIINVLREHAHTGKSGDGLIYVSSVDYSVKIKTGERNNGNTIHSHK
ncbi:P-II family nitrogen regulator [Maribacter polysaccharolyticus]|uniref:P-II family nitrogen regulator n=1 Tax=Maribacter polysaccharolyticus TaxID=3020831 RepID=UPI00237FA5AD|nr:P-II family nitrogen regulator [Maribacter polysaccharolyticus]MDE3741072.1 P-II family nitrogen regulator [Maribacter polysaccharolyticus]